MSSLRSVLAGVVVTAAIAAWSPANAQDLLEALFGWTRDPVPQQRQAEYDYPRQYERQSSPSVEIRLAPPKKTYSKTVKAPAPAAPHVDAFCVRTCDGYYFPLSRSGRATRQQSCDNACPSATMVIYDGENIESARRLDGEKYGSLPTAFSFRNGTRPHCSCNTPEGSQATALRILRDDPTLQAGDIVFKERGAFVYQGSRLSPVESSALVAPSVRSKIRALLAAARSRPQFANAAPKPASAPVMPVQVAQETGPVQVAQETVIPKTVAGERIDAREKRTTEAFLQPLRRALAR